MRVANYMLFFCQILSSSYWLLSVETKMVIGCVGGAIVGTILGAIKGQTTETGFLKGAGIGGLTGAIAAIQLLDSAVDGEPLSKVITLSYCPVCMYLCK